MKLWFDIPTIYTGFYFGVSKSPIFFGSTKLKCHLQFCNNSPSQEDNHRHFSNMDYTWTAIFCLVCKSRPQPKDIIVWHVYTGR